MVPRTFLCYVLLSMTVANFISIGVLAKSCGERDDIGDDIETPNNTTLVRPTKDGLCIGTIEITGSVANLASVNNCTVIQGSLRILLIDYVPSDMFDTYSFPKLTEITGHLVLHRVFGLRSLKSLLPKLTVIRGQELFLGSFALVVNQMRDLEELALVSLTTILKGRVHVSKNHRLCYIETINWAKIAIGVGNDHEHHFQDNREVQFCPDMCSSNCTEYNKRRYCWTDSPGDCQRNLGCSCPNGRPCAPNGECCNKECTGGCTGTTNSDCVACQNVFVDSEGKCMAQCVHGTYEFQKTRCFTDKECLALPDLGLNPSSARFLPMLVDGEKNSDGKDMPGYCVYKCPEYYTLDTEPNVTTRKCSKCKGPCPRACNTTKITSVEDSEKLFGCTTIVGHLEISISSGVIDNSVLEKNLGRIKVVTDWVKIARSYSMLSLNFLSGLEEIRGDKILWDKYSFIVIDNTNLGEIFSSKTTSELNITNGSVQFVQNRKLCFEKIKDFLEKSAPRVVLDKEWNDTAKNLKGSNGDLAFCSQVPLHLMITVISDVGAVLTWDSWKVQDERHLKEYVVKYKKVDAQVESLQDNEIMCSKSTWSFKNVEAKKGGVKDRKVKSYTHVAFLGNLDPYSIYAVYVEANALQEAAISNLIYFRTSPSEPSEPRNLKFTPISPRELQITWEVPENPNGIIAFYRILYKKSSPSVEQTEGVKLKDYCTDTHGTKTPEQREQEIVEQRKKEAEAERKKMLEQDKNCCQCFQVNKDAALAAEKDAEEIIFQDRLLNKVYYKRWQKEDPEKCHFKGENVNITNEEPFLNPSSKIRKKREVVDPNKGKFFNDPLTSQDLHIYVKDDKDDSGPNVTRSVVQQNNTDTTDNTKTTTISTTTIRPTINATTSSFVHEVQTTVLTTVTPRDEIDQTTSLMAKEYITLSGPPASLTNLDHYQIYDVTVMACHATDPSTGKQLCGKVARHWPRTKALPGADNIDTSLVKIENISNKTGDVHIKWSPPKFPNEYITKYNLRYRLLSQETETTLCVSTQKYRNYSGGYRLRLEPGNYSVQLLAYSMAGSGNYTRKLFFTVPSVLSQQQDGTTSVVIGVLVPIFLIVVCACFLLLYWFYKRKYRQAEVLESQNPHYMPHEDFYIPDDWEVTKDDVRLIKEIGQGSFGNVWEGSMYNAAHTCHEPVAIKTVNDQADFQERIKFLKEANIMKDFECHHIVKLLGVVSKCQPPLVVMELMEEGDLRSYLQKCRLDNDQFPDYQPPNIDQTRQMSGEIADGMAYLADRRIIHRDLACRNCLVAGDLTVKIADFGMARDVYFSDYYRKDQGAVLPIRWVAPECLVECRFTTMSDVWSFGIVLWEMVTLGGMPYKGLSNEAVRDYVMDRKIMKTPIGCPSDLADMMEMCWQYDPKQRPTFKNLIEMLVLSGSLNENFKDVAYFFKENPNTDVEDDGEDEEEDGCNVEGDGFDGDDDYYGMSAPRDDSGLMVTLPKVFSDGSQASGTEDSRYEQTSVDDVEKDPYLLPSVGIQPGSYSSRHSSGNHGQSGEHSPLLLYQGDVQEPVLYPPPASDHSHKSSNYDDDLESIDIEHESDNDSNYHGMSKSKGYVSERSMLLPDSPITPRARPNRQAGLSLITTGCPDSGFSQPADSEYTMMSPKSAISSPPFFQPYQPLSASSATEKSTSPNTSNTPYLPPISPALPTSKPILQVNPEGQCSVSKPSRDTGSIFHNSNYADQTGAQDAPTNAYRKHNMSSNSSSSISNPNSASESGSKESNSSTSSSGHHRFNGPTANGHGPFSHQQAALC